MKNSIKTMSKAHPYLLLIKMLAIFNYSDGIIKLNDKLISKNRICQIVGDNKSIFDMSMTILEEKGLAKIVSIKEINYNDPYKTSTKDKKYIAISYKVIKAIYESKNKRKELYR